MHGRGGLQAHASRLLARFLSVSEQAQKGQPQDEQARRVSGGRKSLMGSLADVSSQPTSDDQLNKLVVGLQRSLCTADMNALCEVWATCALRHGCYLPALRRPGDQADNAVAQCCSLGAYTAMVPALRPASLRAHVRVLLDGACGCARRPSAESSALASRAVGGVTRILHLDKKTAADPGLLADVVWRAAILLHSDIVPIYHLGACLLTLVVARRSLADAALGKALVEAAPDFWRVTDSNGGADTIDFCGIQPLLLRGLGRRETRAECLELMRHAASCGPQPQPILEAECTRLLTCVVALLPWLCEQAATRHSDANDPLTPYVAAARGFGKGFGGSSNGLLGASNGRQGKLSGGSGRTEEIVARDLSNACGEVARRGRAEGKGRRELLSIAGCLNNYEEGGYESVARFLHSMRESLRSALEPQPPWVVYSSLCTLLGALGAGPSCCADLLELVRWLLAQLTLHPPAVSDAHIEQHTNGSNEAIMPTHHLWRAAIETSLENPPCAESLADSIQALLGACTSGVLQAAPPDPVVLDRFSISMMQSFNQSMRGSQRLSVPQPALRRTNSSEDGAFETGTPERRQLRFSTQQQNNQPAAASAARDSKRQLSRQRTAELSVPPPPPGPPPPPPPPEEQPPPPPPIAPARTFGNTPLAKQVPESPRQENVKGLANDTAASRLRRWGASSPRSRDNRGAYTYTPTDSDASEAVGGFDEVDARRSAVEAKSCERRSGRSVTSPKSRLPSEEEEEDDSCRLSEDENSEPMIMTAFTPAPPKMSKLPVAETPGIDTPSVMEDAVEIALPTNFSYVSEGSGRRSSARRQRVSAHESPGEPQVTGPSPVQMSFDPVPRQVETLRQQVRRRMSGIPRPRIAMPR